MSNLITELPASPGRIIANERLWLTADRDHVVPEGHPDAAFLFAGAGKSIRRVDAERLGLVETDPAGEEVPADDEEATVAFGGDQASDDTADEEDESEDESEEDADDGLGSLSYQELRVRAKEAGLDASGSKVDLIERMSAISETAEEEEESEAEEGVE